MCDDKTLNTQLKSENRTARYYEKFHLLGEIFSQGGTLQVPCLHIEKNSGEVQGKSIFNFKSECMLITVLSSSSKCLNRRSTRLSHMDFRSETSEMTNLPFLPKLVHNISYNALIVGEFK